MAPPIRPNSFPGARQAARGNAIEYLENALGTGDRALLMPLVDDTPEEERLRLAAERHGFPEESEVDALEAMLDGDDPWLRGCALYVDGRRRVLEDLDTAPVEARLKPLLAFVRKLTLTPAEMSQADADAVFEAGWEEQALHDAIAVTARAVFMQRLVEGHGFTPVSREVAAKHAKRRIERGYVNLYRAFREDK